MRYRASRWIPPTSRGMTAATVATSTRSSRSPKNSTARTISAGVMPRCAQATGLESLRQVVIINAGRNKFNVSNTLMVLQNLKVSECYESETNPRGADFAGKQFDELVASVKEKGVLVPVLARPRPKNGKKFEIVAGSRRLRAARQAGFAEIPAQVDEDR